MTEEEKKKLRAEEERYKIHKNAADTFTKNFFVLPISTGTLTVFVLNYSLGGEKPYYFAAFILFISLALATFSVWRYMKLALEVQDDDLRDIEKMTKFYNAKYTCFRCFTISICVLFVGMFVIFCCKIALISKILALYQCYCNIIH